MTDGPLPIEAAVAAYNRYRRPMATAAVRSRARGSFTVRFDGPFATTCCRDDYFEDLIWEFPEFGVDPDRLRIAGITRLGRETFDVEFETTAPPPEPPDQ